MTIKKLVAGAKGASGNSTGADIADAVNDLTFGVGVGAAYSADHVAVDMHYGALLGVGWRDGELGGAVPFAIATPALAGESQITLTNASAILVGQLLCVFDGQEHYIHLVLSKSSNTLSLYPRFAGNVSAIYPFYTNESHPNTFGYRALADYAIRQMKNSKRVVSNCYLRRNLGAATITQNTSDTASNMGSSSVAAYDVTTNTVASQGIQGALSIDNPNTYVADVTLRCADSAVRVFITAATQISFDTEVGVSGVVSIPFTTTEPNQRVTIRVAPINAGATVNVLERVRICEVSSNVAAIATGTHLMLGDSWFAATGFVQRLIERFPSATFINKGVGGRTATAILNNFDTAATGVDPDFVWIICGTNDYYGNVTTAAITNACRQIKNKIAQKNAKAVFINSSVGSADMSATRFNLSRQYASQPYYENFALQNSFQKVTYSIPPVTVAAGQTAQLANLGFFEDKVAITYAYVMGAGVTVRTKQTLGGSSTAQLTSIASDTVVSTQSNYFFDGQRWIDVLATNATGAPITYFGFIEITRDF
jgi:hypothetical protein